MTASTRRIAAGTAALGVVLAGAIAVPATAAPAVEAAAPAAFLAPYYTELDQTGDDTVTDADLAVLAALIGSTSASANFDAELDFDADGSITASDLALLSQRIIYDDGPFEIVEASAVDMQAAMNAGVTTSVALTEEYIARIAAYDRTVVSGTRALNSIVTVGGETALAAAAAADAERAEHGMTSMLLGIPIALKDNYNTADMPTTAGCGCWNLNQTEFDATMVEGLRADGAVILAKASMDEFAINLSSSWTASSAPGSQVDVASPYSTDRNSGGSSGGTGAAISANLAAIGFGTDTGGSIRVPAHYNQLVGVRPTVGLASRDGIIPLALSQDTGGPMARSVTDAAIALDAVVGVDAGDPVTARQEGLVPESYTSFLDENALDGAKIGYFAGQLGTDAATLALWEQTKDTMEALGAEVVEVAPPTGLRQVFAEGSGSGPEFNHDLQNYINAYLNPAVPHRTLDAVSKSGHVVSGRGYDPAPNRAGTYEDRATVTEATYQAWAGPEGTHTRQLAAGKTLLTQTMDAQGIDAIVYPVGAPYGTFNYRENNSNVGGSMRLSPNTGLPAVNLPVGQLAGSTGGASNVNLEMLGRDFAEGELLGLAYALEQATHARTTPAGFGPLAAG